MDVDVGGVADDTGFEVRLEELIPRGYRLACGMLHDPGRAEDAVQEAALKAWRKRARRLEALDLDAWFLAIVANECRSARRRRWLSVLSLDGRDLPAAGPQDAVLRRADLRRALLALPHRDRLVVVLFYYLDLSLDDTARVAGLSRAAARGRLYRALRRLRPGVELKEDL